MSAEYEIVKYRPELKEQVVELQKELWSSDTGLNRLFLEWKYENNPYRREPLIYLALHRGQAVGMRGFHGAKLEVGTPSRAFPILVAGDALIAAGHRDHSLVTRILKAAYADLGRSDSTYLFSLGASSRINVLGLLTSGWKSVGPLGPVGRVTARVMRSQKVRRVMARLPLLWKYQDAAFLMSADERYPFRHLDAAAGRPARGSMTIEGGPRVDAMADLVERLGHDGRVRHVRDREYLRWRFQNPFSEYRFLYCGEARLQGYLVLNRKNSPLADGTRVHIADLVASDDHVRAELLATAITAGRFPELVTWTSSLSDEELRLLKKLGFAPVDPEVTSRGCPCILVRALRDDLPETEWALGGRPLLDAKSWDWRLLYSMRG